MRRMLSDPDAGPGEGPPKTPQSRKGCLQLAEGQGLFTLGGGDVIGLAGRQKFIGRVPIMPRKHGMLLIFEK